MVYGGILRFIVVGFSPEDKPSNELLGPWISSTVRQQWALFQNVQIIYNLQIELPYHLIFISVTVEKILFVVCAMLRECDSPSLLIPSVNILNMSSCLEL